MLATFVAALVLATMAILTVGSWHDAEAAKYPRLWGTKEIRLKNLKPFPQWAGVLKRYFKESGMEEKDCGSTEFNKCHLAGWQSFLDSLADESVVAQIRSVNRYMNEVKYITDIRNWNVEDYWVTPHQFFVYDGDCEDYSIAKYMSLRALGFPVGNMRIVVVQDQNLNIGHAILAVYLKGKAFILDNQAKRIIAAKKIKHYKPFYSVNEKNSWLHRR